MGALERAERAEAAPSGLEQVYFENRERLLRFLRARGASEAAEDLVQELWIRASAGATGPVRDPLPYLYRIANNLMLDRRRGEMRQARREQDWSAGADAPLSEGSEAPSAERALIARQQLEAVCAAFGALGERTETVFRRFRLEGASQKQIADDLGISLSAVEKHLQKAYRALIELRRSLDAD